MSFQPPSEPATELGHYRILSSTAGVRVSPLAFGAMSLGTAWPFMGAVDQDQAFKLLDAYAEAGGNFVDTANNYQDEESEQFIGRWMAARENRDQIFLATKYTNNYTTAKQGYNKVANAGGNHRKALRLSVEASLRKLQTDYIDLLYVHWWDYTSSIEEVMDSLHLLVEQGKVLYLGISDTPAWVVSAANEYAKAHGKSQFSVYQGRWNVVERDFERDIIPMARQYGMALAPWSVLGGGRIQSKKQREAIKNASDGGGRSSNQSEDDAKVSDALEKVAAEHGTESIQQIALAYVLHKARRVFPIIGGRKVEHLQDNIKALSIRLTDEQIKYIEGIREFDLGFPLSFIGDDPRETDGHRNELIEMLSGTKIAFEKAPKPIGHV